MSQQSTVTHMNGMEIKSAMQARRFAVELIVKTSAVNAYFLEGCERRMFSASQCVAVNQKSKPQPSQG
ncbi:hypothetical protein RI592_017545 [Klebsiella pneumoniae]|nr:hypothetical protein [Klebsiella pneumoniae]